MISKINLPALFITLAAAVAAVGAESAVRRDPLPFHHPRGLWLQYALLGLRQRREMEHGAVGGLVGQARPAGGDGEIRFHDPPLDRRLE